MIKQIKFSFWNYLKNLLAMLIVQFAFYLLIAIAYDWILMSLDFQKEFSWNLVFLITFSLMIFSMLFPRAYGISEMKRRGF
jgi:hypothetical protein